MEELLQGSGVFIYILSAIIIISYSSFTKIQRISIIYICTYGLTFTAQYSTGIILVLLAVVMFIYEEYLTEDTMKTRILYKWRYKVMDALFMAVFQYKILWMMVGLLLRSDELEILIISGVGCRFWTYMESPVEILAFFCVFVGSIHSMYVEKETYFPFNVMYQRMQKYPYYMIDFSDDLMRRLTLVADMEDDTYFDRHHSYSCLSLEFIWIWRAKHGNTKKRAEECKNIAALLRQIKKRFKAEGWQRTIGRALLAFREAGHQYIDSWRERVRWLNGVLLRGHSTIEMQLLRILAYQEGLLLGRPVYWEQWIRILKRKAFEVLYSRMFFDGLKNYLSKSLCNNLVHYRQFLVVQYLHIVQSKVGRLTYRPLDEMYADKNIEKWPMEMLFLTCLGLNSRKITMDRVWMYYNVIQKYKLDAEKLGMMVARL